MMHKTMLVSAFAQAISDGVYPPGCVVLVMNGEVGWLSKWIQLVQRRALPDLFPNLKENEGPERVNFYSAFTHAAIIESPSQMGEQKFPCAQRTHWTELAGKTILVRRLIDTPNEKLADVVAEFHIDLAYRAPYDWRDLFGFLVRWETKLLWRLKFHRVFGNRKAHVCSTRCLIWHIKAKLMSLTAEDLYGWYPARLAIDETLFEDVQLIKLI